MTDRTTFIDWYASLAPEGETALLVRQRPILANGEIQLYADGAVKATWPAMLPNVRIREDWAVYLNTGSFILSRFPEGRPAARLAYMEHMLFIILDDVFTAKVPRTPPVPPTWRMESSPGSEQWGYAFDLDAQPTKAVGATLTKRLAEAGYTDPGACNAVRNCRAPGSVNLKPKHAGFRAKLLEFHPERAFTVEALCEGFGVTLGEVEPIGAYAPLRVADDGSDVLLAWLGEQGHVLGRPNAEGWLDVLCPWADQHTDGHPASRYNPTTRGWCCLHSHCIERTTADYLAHCEAAGAPHVEQGVRDELLSSALSQALSVLPAQSDEAQRAQAAADTALAEAMERVERQDTDALTRTEWFRRYAMVLDSATFFDLELRTQLSRAAFDAQYRATECRSMHAAPRAKPKLILPSNWFDENRIRAGSRALAGVTYAPGEGALAERDGCVLGNRWRDARPARRTTGASVRMYLDHCELIFGEHREQVWDAMAFKVQFPRIKINWALLLGGVQGCGKDTAIAPLMYAVGGPEHRNIGQTVGDQIAGNFNYELESELLILNELYEPGEANSRRAVANRLKPIIAAPPEELSINRKGLPPYFAPNRLWVVAFTNFRIPIYLDPHDRRWFCVWSQAPRLGDENAERLWAWYQAGGFDAITEWFHARDVSKFNPKVPPPMTDFKLSLIEDSRSTAESLLADMIENRRGPFAHGAICSPLDRVLIAVEASGTVPPNIRLSKVALLAALTAANWIDAGQCASRKHITKATVWHAPQLHGTSKSVLLDLARRPAPMPGDALRVVGGNDG